MYCLRKRDREKTVPIGSYPGGNDEPGQDEPDEITVKDLKYKLNHDKKTATVIGPANKNIKKITIPDTVKSQNGTVYKVTAIANKAFKGCKKATETTIGKNVQSIGKDAYNGCKSLKKITIKTKNLTLKSVGKNAFKKIAKKVTVKCPKGMKESYKKILAKKGMPKTATYK